MRIRITRFDVHASALGTSIVAAGVAFVYFMYGAGYPIYLLMWQGSISGIIDPIRS